MPRIRIAVTENHPFLDVDTPAWEKLAESVERVKPELLVLGELPFGGWLAASNEFDQAAWDASVEAHERCIAALGELGAPAVVGSRAVNEDGKRVNEAFVWTAEGGVVSCPHTKQHIPQSDGFYEQTWTEQGKKQFETVEVAGLKIGFMICTDIMFPEHAREYGRQGANLIVCPRATPPAASEVFRASMHTAATVSGCYVATSNRGASLEELMDPAGGARFEGRAHVINPAASLVAQTNPFDPIVVAEIDPELVAWKQTLYPCDLW